MLAESLIPQPEGRVRFNYYALRLSPKESGCYALANYDGVVLYVGKAGSIAGRMEDHLDAGDKSGKTPHGHAHWLYYRFCPVNYLKRLETGWVNEHQLKENGKRPFFNKIAPPS